MIFRILSGEGWMQDLELQELILDALDADIGLLEHMFQAEDVRRERIF